MDIFPKTIVSVDWLQQNINDSSLIILDATIKKVSAKENVVEQENLGIPGNLFFDLKKKFSDQQSTLPNTIPSSQQFTKECQALGINQNSKIVIYDKIGVYSSPRAWWLFRTMGHEQVAVLDGGLPEWIRASGQLAGSWNQKTERKPGNFKANLQKEWVVNHQEVLINIKSKTCHVLDARSSGRFNGTAPEPREGLIGGHIPASFSLPFPMVLDDGKFKSKEELKLIFDEFDLSDKKAIYSCGSGITASIIMLAAHIAGYTEGAVYDGSWSEWGNGNFPVAN